MANRYEVIDESSWERATHCKVFRNSIEPAFGVTFEADITDFREMTKLQGLSFTLSMVYVICKCANEVEALRYRFLDRKIVLYERVDTAFTYLNKTTGLFKVVNVPFVDSLQEYVKLASKTAEEQEEYFTGALGNDVFQCSPMPWVTYTHISHTISGNKDQATPLFDWGKYYEKDGRLMIRHGRKYCVSDIRQNQEFHMIHVHDWGLFPLSASIPAGRDGMGHQGTSCQVGTKLRSDEMIGESTGESAGQVQRYIRLTELIPEILRMVDDGKIALTPAVELSYLTKQEQCDLLETMESEDCTPSFSQAIQMKKSKLLHGIFRTLDLSYCEIEEYITFKINLSILLSPSLAR